MPEGAHPRHIHIDIGSGTRHWGRGHVNFHAPLASWADIHIGGGLEWRPRRAWGTAVHTEALNCASSMVCPSSLLATLMYADLVAAAWQTDTRPQLDVTCESGVMSVLQIAWSKIALPIAQ